MSHQPNTVHQPNRGSVRLIGLSSSSSWRVWSDWWRGSQLQSFHPTSSCFFILLPFWTLGIFNLLNFRRKRCRNCCYPVDSLSFPLCIFALQLCVCMCVYKRETKDSPLNSYLFFSSLDSRWFVHGTNKRKARLQKGEPMKYHAKRKTAHCICSGFLCLAKACLSISDV